MPELPEVETVLRTLESRIKDKKILACRIISRQIINGDAEEFRKRITGETFRSFKRRGKYLLFIMDDLIMVSHLRMEGKYFIQKPEEPLIKHTHAVFCLDDGTELRYNDTRRFGRMELIPYDSDLRSFHDLGPEPFDEAFDLCYFNKYTAGRKTPVKSLLLDQEFVAGIGNIYADEILYACGIRPGRSCGRLTQKNKQDIIDQTRRILQEAIAAGGTTIRSYTSSLGVTGLFQLQCMVHSQKQCRICGTDIKIRRIGGRSSYYCPLCQRK
ncbi:MAG: DNA-formamidopyrimidine glycosylase [Solobacterium sp.]|nr:DNA-formamidopyrimidine glycosylase [Solobacterium sp.]